MSAKKETTAKAESQHINQDSGEAQVQKQVDQENAQGFVGVKADPTPDENYSLKGVTAGLPTPETDADAKAEAEAHAKTIHVGPKGE